MLWFHRDGDDVGKQFLACAAWLLLKINKLVVIFYPKAVISKVDAWLRSVEGMDVSLWMIQHFYYEPCVGYMQLKILFVQSYYPLFLRYYGAQI